jgi:hypothetical protein
MPAVQRRLSFRSLVKRYITDLKSGISYEASPDQYVGTIDRAGYLSDQIARGFQVRLRPDDRPRDQRSLLLILESPHKDEFCAGVPIGPQMAIRE